jgi:hypothetical protein
MHGYRAISTTLAAWRGPFEDFVHQLDEDGVRYLSFSKVNTVESCQQRYLLEYVKRVAFKEPSYYRKGSLFHRAASLAYRNLAGGRLNLKPIERQARRHFGDQGASHIQNAIRLLVENAPGNHEVVATELPFVLSLGGRLPPLIGVIDLLLRKGDTFVVVDHKTGKNFYDQDGFQLHLYREHVRRAFRTTRCQAYFDEYRWVNNLDRIRKPAFRRTPVRPIPWSSILNRMRSASKVMRAIERRRWASAGGECMFCPLKEVCPECGSDWESWY